MISVTEGLKREVTRMPEELRKSLNCERGMELANHKQVSIDAASPGPTVRSLEGLEYATSLEAVNFWVVPLPMPGSYSPHLVESLEPLRNLPNLRTIYIEGRGELDLEPLASLPMLEEVFLGGFRIVHLESLLRLEELNRVTLSYAGIVDIASLADWEKPPRYLNLHDNRIADATPLAMNPNFVRGHTINLSYNCIPLVASVPYDELRTNHPIAELWRRGVEVVAEHQSATCNTVR